ncbi:MAG: DNA adenine methylase [Elusimicrobia bacterium]|nr:DNA adenine methylase [Candidatus Liberimonas magnetica]
MNKGEQLIKNVNNFAKPFLKWAGGKSQLLDQFESFFPSELKNTKISSYYEPFLGGGAVFLYLSQKFSIKNSYLFDINEEIVLAYKVIQKNVEDLIEFLFQYTRKYKKLSDSAQMKYFYAIREHYNQQMFEINFKKYSDKWFSRAAQLIFMNKTCFNGLFRVNSQGKFNVPFGRYKNPKILDEDNLRKISKLLQSSEIMVSDFETIKCRKVDSNTFVYYDPPYRPISKTASFTSYSKNDFNEKSQERLAQVFRELDKKEVKQMLSNSDPKNLDKNDNYFEHLYSGFNINRVKATRMINCNSEARGKINELIITNY